MKARYIFLLFLLSFIQILISNLIINITFPCLCAVEIRSGSQEEPLVKEPFPPTKEEDALTHALPQTRQVAEAEKEAMETAPKKPFQEEGCGAYTAQNQPEEQGPFPSDPSVPPAKRPGAWHPSPCPMYVSPSAFPSLAFFAAPLHFITGWFIYEVSYIYNIYIYIISYLKSQIIEHLINGISESPKKMFKNNNNSNNNNNSISYIKMCLSVSVFMCMYLRVLSILNRNTISILLKNNTKTTNCVYFSIILRNILLINFFYSYLYEFVLFIIYLIFHKHIYIYIYIL
eukprot:gene6488-4672_t